MGENHKPHGKPLPGAEGQSRLGWPVNNGWTSRLTDRRKRQEHLLAIEARQPEGLGLDCPVAEGILVPRGLCLCVLYKDPNMEIT